MLLVLTHVLLATLAFASTSASLTQASPAGTGSACRWMEPVDAPIVDPFRPPASPFAGGGNVGVEFGTIGGEDVLAVAEGRVTFVGPVGGKRWVVVTHDSTGLRSTMGPLASTAVVRGQQVSAGSPLGTAQAGLHLTARYAGRYLDPEPLLAGRCGRARLVPSGFGRAGRTEPADATVDARPGGANGGGGPVH